MAKRTVLDTLYAKVGTKLEFNYDSLWSPPISVLIPENYIYYMYKLVTSIKYNSKIDFKESEIKKVFESCGFIRMHAGTHRVAYRSLEYPHIVIKIPLNKSSLMDNQREYNNQFMIKPFCTKVFEVHHSGLLATFERVEPLQSREEFKSVAPDIFDFINSKILGKFVVDDIGAESYMNYGLRSVKTCGSDFGPVLLDFPEIYPLDGDKLYCNKEFYPGVKCSGQIDYDAGYDRLICLKCGAEYSARDLRTSEENGDFIVTKGDSNMKVVVKLKGTNQIVSEYDGSGETDRILTPEELRNRNNKAKKSPLGIIKNPKPYSKSNLREARKDIEFAADKGKFKLSPGDVKVKSNSVEAENEMKVKATAAMQSSFTPIYKVKEVKSEEEQQEGKEEFKPTYKVKPPIPSSIIKPDEAQNMDEVKKVLESSSMSDLEKIEKALQHAASLSGTYEHKSVGEKDERRVRVTAPDYEDKFDASLVEEKTDENSAPDDLESRVSSLMDRAIEKASIKEDEAVSELDVANLMKSLNSAPANERHSKYGKEEEEEKHVEPEQQEPDSSNVDYEYGSVQGNEEIYEKIRKKHHKNDEIDSSYEPIDPATIAAEVISELEGEKEALYGL